MHKVYQCYFSSSHDNFQMEDSTHTSKFSIHPTFHTILPSLSQNTKLDPPKSRSFLNKTELLIV